MKTILLTLALMVAAPASASLQRDTGEVVARSLGLSMIGLASYEHLKSKKYSKKDAMFHALVVQSFAAAAEAIVNKELAPNRVGSAMMSSLITINISDF